MANADDNARISALEARVARLEERPVMIFGGVWKSGLVYQHGTFVTHKGSMWFSHAATSDEPGNGPTNWQLCIKRGRDATRRAMRHYDPRNATSRPRVDLVKCDGNR